MTWPTTGTTRTSTTEWKQLRQRMRTELNHACQHANRGPCAGQLELDHIHAHAEGGTNDPTNLQWLCKRHHAIKSQKEAAKGRQLRRDRGRFETEPHPGLTHPGSAHHQPDDPTP